MTEDTTKRTPGGLMGGPPLELRSNEGRAAGPGEEASAGDADMQQRAEDDEAEWGVAYERMMDAADRGPES